ncbi:MAG: transglycosylase SLT domain-containing protein [Myxococcales bacterium]|nr:transglycosylase SLT domain-containing protein [Myxococcales bacterium]
MKRRWIVLLAFVAGTGGGALRSTGSPRAVAQEGSTGGSFDPAAAEPDAATQSLRRQWERALPGKARDAAAKAADNATGEQRGDFHWIAARAAPDDASALPHYEEVAKGSHVLSPWARLRCAEITFDQDPEGAKAKVEGLLDGWAGARDARIAYAKALAKLGQRTEALPLLRAAATSASNDWAAADAIFPLGNLLAEGGTPEERIEAIELYRTLAATLPGTGAGREADRAAERWLRTLPEESRKNLHRWPTALALRRAHGLFQARRYREAASEFRALIRILDPPDNCEARLMEGKSVLEGGQREEAIGLFTHTVQQCTAPDIQAPALYLIARTLSKMGRYGEAIEIYDRVEPEAPGHRLADDALFRSALSAIEQGNVDEARTRLALAANRYPDGDMRHEARFRAAFLAWQAGDKEEALALLEGALADPDPTPAEGQEGRAEYWRSRVLLDLGHREEALFGFEQIALAHPLSYHAQLAVARLRALEERRAQSVLRAWQGERQEKVTFPDSELTTNPAFARAVTLLRLGDDRYAARELASLGMLDRDSDPQTLWLTAALYSHAGFTTEALEIARRKIHGFRRTPPVGHGYARWRYAYPSPYAEIIDKASDAHGVPAAFVRAVAREESSFNPRAVSPAKAYGLVQLIRPTAKRWGAEIGVPARPEDLREPENNIPIGTRFMRFLKDRFDGQLAVIPAGYNAGPYAADRWLRERADFEVDAWIEAIPYDETRRYSRRVLQSYGIYQWLDEGQLPALSLSLPAPKTGS